MGTDCEKCMFIIYTEDSGFDLPYCLLHHGLPMSYPRFGNSCDDFTEGNLKEEVAHVNVT